MQEALFNFANYEITSDDYYTPKWLFDLMGLEFDIDVAAPEHGIPWIPAKTHYSQINDGLSKDWGGGLVWMNPPFSKPGPWFDKFIDNGNGVALAVVSRSKWFHKIWACADAIVATPVDMEFVRPKGEGMKISYQTFLFALGEPATTALHGMKLSRVR